LKLIFFYNFKGVCSQQVVTTHQQVYGGGLGCVNLIQPLHKILASASPSRVIAGRCFKIFLNVDQLHVAVPLKKQASGNARLAVVFFYFSVVQSDLLLQSHDPSRAAASNKSEQEKTNSYQDYSIHNLSSSRVISISRIPVRRAGNYEEVTLSAWMAR